MGHTDCSEAAAESSLKPTKPNNLALRPTRGGHSQMLTIGKLQRLAQPTGMSPCHT